MSRDSRFTCRLARHLFAISAFMVVILGAGCAGSGSSSSGPAAPTTPSLSAAIAPQGAFGPNEVGAKYSITVSNAAGAAATSGTVTVTDPDTNFTVTSITGGNGSLWVCTLATLSCTRSDSLAAGASYDPIIVTGNVTAGAGQSVGIGITISGGGLTTAVSSPGSIAIVSALTISKVFNPAAINLSANSALTFTITNPAANTVAQTGVAFTDTLPAGLVVATPNGLANTCGGTATATAASGSISLTGGTVGVNTNCTLTVNVTGTQTGTSITNTSGAVGSTNGGNGNTASATLSVAAPPAITKAFGAASVPLNGTTLLTLTLTNPTANTFALSGVAFTDTLPAGLQVEETPLPTSSCGGTLTPVSVSISLTGGTIAQGGTCTVSATVGGITAGAKANTANQISSTQSGPTATTSNTATLAVVAPPAISKAFGSTGVAVNASTSLTFTITNPAANTVAQAGVAFTDNFPANLVVATPNGLVDNCGGTAAAVAGSGSVVLTAGSVAVSGTCTVVVNVTATAANTFNNTTLSVSSTNGGTGNTASASLTAATPPTLTKAFGVSTTPANVPVSLTFTLTNPATNTVALTGVAFTDNFPANLVVATSPGLTNTCGGTPTATAGSSTVSLSAGTVAINSNCVITVNVTGTAAGTEANAISAIVSAQTGMTTISATASLIVIGPPTISKVFGASSILVSGQTSLTFMLANPNAANSLSGIGFTDTLPSGLQVSSPTGLTGSCGGGTITAGAGSGSVVLSGATLGATASCTFGVNVTGIGTGAQNNVTSNVTSNEGGNGGTGAASITVGSNTATSITSLVLHPNDVTSGTTSIGTAIFNGSAPSGATLTLGSTNTSAAMVPASMPIPTGATSVNFTITEPVVASTTSSTISASASFGGSQQSTLTVNPVGSVYITSLTLSPGTVDASTSATGSFTGTIDLSGTVSANTTVSLSSSNTSAATVPATVTVFSGQAGVSFTGTVPEGSSFLTSTITATLSGANETALLTVDPAGTLIVQSVVLSPAAVVGGATAPNGTATGTVTLSAAPTINTTVSLSSDNAAAAVPSSVTVLASQTTGTFPITTTGVTLSATATITASLNGSGSHTFNINPPLTITTTNPLSLGAEGVTYLGTGSSLTPGLSVGRRGGVGSYTWSATGLPSGLSIGPTTGAIQGTPTTPSSSSAGTSFTVSLTDSEVSPVTVQTTLNITVVDPTNACANVVAGTINNALLDGPYGFLLSALQGTTGTPVAEAGSIPFNGNGGIGTGGEVDINMTSGPQHLTITGGSYTVNTTGLGCVQVTYSGGSLTGQVFHFALSGARNGSNVAIDGSINEFDAYQGAVSGAILGEGEMRIQNTTEFSNSVLPSRVVAGGHGFDSAGLAASFGETFALSGTSVTNFNEVFNDGGTITTITPSEVTSASLTSTTTTATSGREMFSFTVGTGAEALTFTSAVYIENKNQVVFATINPIDSNHPILAGLSMGTFSTYSNSSVSGSYDFRETGLDTTNSNGVCLPPSYCAAVQFGVVDFTLSGLTVTGTSFESENGVTSPNTISDTTYSVNSTTGIVTINSSGGGAPGLFVADPVLTGSDQTDNVALFLVDSSPAAGFGRAEAVPTGPFSLNSPPSYVASTDFPVQISVPEVVGTGTFFSGLLTFNRDLSGTGGLVINVSNTFDFTTINSDGTASGTINGNSASSFDGVTNSTATSPGDALLVPTTASPAALRLLYQN
jgi:hypothetical protein